MAAARKVYALPVTRGAGLHLCVGPILKVDGVDLDSIHLYTKYC